MKTITEALRDVANPTKAALLQNYFKTGKGEYGEGDIFLGITVPKQRSIAHTYKDLPLDVLKKMLSSKVHEFRFTALEILVMKYEKGSSEDKDEIYKFYLNNMSKINNWDLVDTSAPYIVGQHLIGKDKKILYTLAKSSNLWERRIAIVSTFIFIKNNYFKDALKLARILIDDKQDLLHKAVGWMLREVGKKNKKVLDEFLLNNYKKMPRTMLRYAIEKHSKKEKEEYMKK